MHNIRVQVNSVYIYHYFLTKQSVEKQARTGTPSKLMRSTMNNALVKLCRLLSQTLHV